MLICNVEFDLPSGPVGVLCSGGADSSLVLYLLMKYSTQPIHIFTLCNKNKHYTNNTVIANVIDWCLKNTENNNIKHHVNFAEQQTSSALYHLPFQYLKNKTIENLYIGDTCWPPDEINEQFAINDVIQNKNDRSPHVERPTYWKNFYIPFTNYNKKKIAEIYQDQNIMQLFDLTRSCETLDNIGLNHCGECWWCKERSWAFSLDK